MAVAIRTEAQGIGEPTRRAAPTDVLLVVLALGFAILGLRPLSDPDVWWHLRTGELIVHSGFTRTDPWSTASSNVWLLHEWGAEVLMYLSFAIGGYRGVIVLHSLGMLLLAAVLFRSIRKNASPLVAAVVALISAVGLVPGTAERPQLASWCLLAAVLPALRRWVSAERPPWWLPPVIALWANLHGLWSAAIVLYGFLVIGLALQLGLSRWRGLIPFVGVGVVSILAAALTPNGPGLILAPLQVREYAKFVSEWQPPGLMNPFFACGYLILGIVVVSWARRRAPVPSVDVAFVVGAAYLGLAYIRTVPILIIALAPLAAAGLQQMVSGRPPAPIQRTVDFRVMAGVLVAAFLAAAAVWLPQVRGVQAQAPWRASAVLDALPGRAHVLNEYGVGGWLLWTARDVSPSIDGRTEIYSPDYVAKAMGAPQMSPGWRDFVRENHFDAALLSKRSPLVYGLRTLGWSEIFRDGRRVILVPPTDRAGRPGPQPGQGR